MENEVYKVGEKVLYCHDYGGIPCIDTLTIREVTYDKQGFKIIFVEEFDEPVNPYDVYTKDVILKMLKTNNTVEKGKK